jgi:hypothetical protein
MFLKNNSFMHISLRFGLKIILIFKLIKPPIGPLKYNLFDELELKKYSIVALKISFFFVNLFIKLLILKCIFVFLIERFSISRFHNFCI